MTFEQLLQKAISEREFGQRIITDPEGALKEVGIEPTPVRIRALKDAALALLSAKCAIEIDNI